MGKQIIKNQSLSQAFYNGELDIKTSKKSQQPLTQVDKGQENNDLNLERDSHQRKQSDRKVIMLHSRAHPEINLKTSIHPMLRALALKSMLIKE